LGLAGKSDFLLLGEKSFLDSRKIELFFIRFLRRKSVVSFLGDDIRSPVLTRQFMQENCLDTFVNYSWYRQVNSVFHDYEITKREIAELNQQYANLILTAPNDQTSYLDLESGKVAFIHGFIALSRDAFNSNVDKFVNLEKIRILHAPTDFHVKGTEYVRSAIDQLKREGYVFEYQELIDVPHEQVRKALFNAHICLNQFRGLGMGVLGVEAMAARSVTFMSAFPNLEPSIPKPDSQAWIESKGSDLLDNLRIFLSNPDLLEGVANSGFIYAFDNYSSNNSGRLLQEILSSRGIVC
jgi:hypothetical protein